MSSQLILASVSPRRRDLLSSAGIHFTVIPSDTTEAPQQHESPQGFAVRAAIQKAMAVANRFPDHWVIGADTVVAIDDIILGKPRGEHDARNMLLQLSGRDHLVITGYALVTLRNKKRFTGFVETIVTMKPLEESEIAWYINTGEPFDKAGAYAIQGNAAFMVQSIKGSYTNVVGLPLCELVSLLQMHGVVRI
jgi:septum formation protein